MAKKEEIGFAELHTQLRIISRLLAAQLKPAMGQQEMIRLLASTGASHAEIADVLGTTSATIGVTLQRLKKKAIRPNSESENATGAATEDLANV